jgi:hypothetical protein
MEQSGERMTNVQGGGPFHPVLVFLSVGYFQITEFCISLTLIPAAIKIGLAVQLEVISDFPGDQ